MFPRRCRLEAAEAHRRGKRAAGARDDDHVDAVDVNRRGLLAPKSPATATHEQRAVREARDALAALDAVAADGGGREPRKIDVALGEVHGALARLHCEGRWTQALPDAASALLHAATGAARGDARCAYALARWHRRLPHPLLPAAPGCDVDLPAAPAPLDLDGPCLAPTRAAQESELPNFKGSYLGRFPLISADFWTSDHLSERSRSMDAFSGTRARGTLTLNRR